jgi:ABC-type nitrate/sulfonate/bicarbonate transport system substrate-binding protein
VAAPALVLGAEPVAVAPSRDVLTVGYYESGVQGQLPLLLALVSGYFEEAGFDEVILVETENTFRDVRRGDLDFAVVPSRQAFNRFLDQRLVPAIAGYKNYARNNGRYGGDLLVAQPGLAEYEPATVTAFLSAYVRALQDLSDPGAAAEALERLQASDVAVPDRVIRRWEDSIEPFAPFDGGFGSYDDAAGLGELLGYLADDRKERRAFGPFVSAQHLNIAQARQGLGANPGLGLVGPPSITRIRVGVPMADAATEPLAAAQAAGYFEAAGFEDVEVMDVEEPLLGLLNGELDFGVVSAVDAADGAAQGLPAPSLAGHQNYDQAGAYGGDVLLTRTGLLEDDPSTASAFLIAYLQALQDLRAAGDTRFAQFDGGYGSQAEGGGTGELQAYLREVLGQEPDLSELLDSSALQFAQAWWGLPANPSSAEPPVTAASSEEAA